MRGISNLYRSSRRAYDFLKDNRYFDHMVIDGSHLIVLNEINDLTGFCIPDFVATGAEPHVRFELGFAVVDRSGDRVDAFKSALASEARVSLPRITPSAHFLDCSIKNGRASDWLIETMSADMATFTMTASEGLEMLARSEDRRVRKFRNVYSDLLEELIFDSLRQIVG